MDQTYCRNCGKKVYKSLKFCPYCGKKQTSSFSKEEVKKNPYQVLQISVDAEPEVVNAAYKSLSKKYHPDIDSSHNAQEKMKEINWAYSVISNPERRKEWDEKQETGGSQRTTPQAQKSTIRTDPRVKYQESNRKKKPQTQQKPGPPPPKKEKFLTPGRSALLALFLLIGIPLCLYFFINASIAPPAYSHSKSGKTSIPPTAKQTPTTPRPTRTPKPPTATPDPSSIMLPYSESFTIDRGVWYVGDDEEASFIISNGEYLIIPKKPGGSWWANPGAWFDHIVLEFTTIYKYTYPSSDGGFYVKFRCENSENDECYTLFVSENGYITVSNKNRILVDHGFSEHINLYDKPNYWAIVMDGNMFAIYCNDEFIADFTNYEYQEGEFGFGVKNSMDDQWGFNGIAFDDIRVFEKNDPSTFGLPTPYWLDLRINFATMRAQGTKFVPVPLHTSLPNWAQLTLQAP